jgi:hypothetical protein
VLREAGVPSGLPTTSRLQKRSVFLFLKETLIAPHAGQTGPKLVLEW